MQIYLINLDRVPDRLAHMQRSFDAAGIAFTRIAATDGRMISEDARKRYQAKEGYWGWLTPGEIGCFLSHRLCWQAIADGDDAYGAVFEDDVLLGENAGKILTDSTWIPANADIVKLETAGSRIYVDMLSAAEVCGRSVKRLRSSHYCTGAYILSKSAARHLLHESGTFNEAVDDVLFSARAAAAASLKKYQIIPALCTQRSRNSSNLDDAQLPSSIEGREQKTMKRLSLSERVRLITSREGRSLINKLFCLLGKRERIVVDFK